MKQTERASIFRIVSDLIKADAIIDTREIESLDSIRNKYAIKKEDEILGSSYTLSEAAPSPHFVTSILTASLAYCSFSKLPNVNLADGLALSGIRI